MTAGTRRPPSLASATAMLIVLVALAIRLYHLPMQSLSYDEAVSVYLARLGLADMLAWTASDVQPPLYYLMLKAWLPLAGASEYAVRLPSVAAMVLAVALFYRLGRELASQAPSHSPTARGDNRRVGLCAAFVAALHPWYAWHAQDARMYGQLLALCLLASLLLIIWWRRENGAPPPEARARRSTAALTLALALTYFAAIYTHYLAASFFAYHVVALTVVAWRRRRWPSLRRYLTRVLVPAAVLYLPWLPAVAATAGQDSSYYSGPLKATEVLSDAFTALFVGGVGETVFEQQGLTLAGVLAALLVLLLALRWRRVGRARLLLVLGAFFVPAICSLALLAVAPKFNPRYLFPTSVALPLLWGLALPPASPRADRVVSLAALTVLTAVSAAVLVQTALDPAFTRADFRGAVAAIRHGLQPGERVLLSSGHIYPIWEYYAQDTPYTAVPPLRVLSVDTIVRLDDLPALAEDLAHATGVWVLRWQDDVTDPMRVLTYALDCAGDAATQAFWHVGIDHYRLTAALPSDPLALATPIGANFAGLLTLKAVAQVDAGSLAIFWEAVQPLPDLRATLTLRDAAGHEVAKTAIGLAGDGYPTTRWRPGETVLGYLSLGSQPAVPAGSYAASIAVHGASGSPDLAVVDATGTPSGTSCPLGRLMLPDGTGSITAQEALVAHSLQATSAEWQGLRLIGAGVCPTAPLPPGARFALPLLWQATGDHDANALVATLTEESGGSISLASDPLTVSGDGYEWHSGDIVLTWLDVAVPPTATGGAASLSLRARDRDSEASELALCSLVLADVRRRYELPTPRFVSDASVGGFARLLGADAECQPCAPGADVAVTVYWQAIATAEDNYVAFVHLLGPDGRVWAQVDREPLDGSRPTSGWLAGEVVYDTATLSLPPDAPPGEYQLEAGFYDSAVSGLPRLWAEEAGQHLANDAIRLGAIEVR